MRDDLPERPRRESAGEARQQASRSGVDGALELPVADDHGGAVSRNNPSQPAQPANRSA